MTYLLLACLLLIFAVGVTLLKILNRLIDRIDTSLDWLSESNLQMAQSIDSLQSSVADLKHLIEIAMIPSGPIVTHQELAPPQSVNRRRSIGQ